MSPFTHFLGSWTVGAIATNNPRDCRLVALAGVLPDLDGLGLVVDVLNGALGRETQFYARYHHYLLHGIFGALVIAGILTLFARQRWRVALLCLLMVHLHILCDLLGSRGPSTVDVWPIFYLGPFDHVPMWLWKWQWRLNGWENRVITLALFGWALWHAERRGFSPVGVFSPRADAIFVQTLRKWRAELQQRFLGDRRPAD